MRLPDIKEILQERAWFLLPGLSGMPVLLDRFIFCNAAVKKPAQNAENML